MPGFAAGFAEGPAEPSAEPSAEPRAGFAAAPLVGTEAPSGSEQISDPGYLREANPNPNPKILTLTLTPTPTLTPTLTPTQTLPLTPPQRRVGASRSRTLGRPSEPDVSAFWFMVAGWCRGGRCTRAPTSHDPVGGRPRRVLFVRENHTRPHDSCVALYTLRGVEQTILTSYTGYIGLLYCSSGV